MSLRTAKELATEALGRERLSVRHNGKWLAALIRAHDAEVRAAVIEDCKAAANTIAYMKHTDPSLRLVSLGEVRFVLNALKLKERPNAESE